MTVFDGPNLVILLGIKGFCWSLFFFVNVRNEMMLAFYSEDERINEGGDLQNAINLTRDNIKAIIMTYRKSAWR
ncbi:hypothetical protein L2E82_48597 [Cichorium intybus]|uniref:Uncharacterized protein n=1 Tax=Cichorium intybus TaxID=13427 RepID=A0ACB8YZ86_CICIN|nr:hypothetical protein L2E82_48597 [Cichorium intybus]